MDQDRKRLVLQLVLQNSFRERWLQHFVEWSRVRMALREIIKQWAIELGVIPPGLVSDSD